MSHTYRIDPARRLVIFTFDEWPDTREVAEMLSHAAADPLFQPGFGALVDHRAVPQAPDALWIQRGVDTLATHWLGVQGGRMAVLATGAATYGMGRMAEAFAESRGLEFQAFTDEAQALAWLSEGGRRRGTAS